MAVVIPAGYGQATVVLKHNLIAREASVVFGVNAAASATADQVANTVFDAWRDSLLSRQDSEVFLERVEVRFTPTGATVPVSGVSNLPRAAGLAVFPTPPAQVAVLLKKVTGQGGRSNRGRMYLPWFTGETEVGEDGRLDASVIAAVQTAATSFLSQLAIVEAGEVALTMAILHNDERVTTTRTTNSVTRTRSPFTPGPPTAVTALLVDSVVATQRRRLRP